MWFPTITSPFFSISMFMVVLAYLWNRRLFESRTILGRRFKSCRVSHGRRFSYITIQSKSCWAASDRACSSEKYRRWEYDPNERATARELANFFEARIGHLVHGRRFILQWGRRQQWYIPGQSPTITAGLRIVRRRVRRSVGLFIGRRILLERQSMDTAAIYTWSYTIAVMEDVCYWLLSCIHQCAPVDCPTCSLDVCEIVVTPNFLPPSYSTVKHMPMTWESTQAAISQLFR